MQDIQRHDELHTSQLEHCNRQNYSRANAGSRLYPSVPSRLTPAFISRTAFEFQWHPSILGRLRLAAVVCLLLFACQQGRLWVGRGCLPAPQPPQACVGVVTVRSFATCVSHAYPLIPTPETYAGQHHLPGPTLSLHLIQCSAPQFEHMKHPAPDASTSPPVQIQTRSCRHICRSIFTSICSLAFMHSEPKPKYGRCLAEQLRLPHMSSAPRQPFTVFLC